MKSEVVYEYAGSTGSHGHDGVDHLQLEYSKVMGRVIVIPHRDSIILALRLGLCRQNLAIEIHIFISCISVPFFQSPPTC